MPVIYFTKLSPMLSRFILEGIAHSPLLANLIHQGYDIAGYVQRGILRCPADCGLHVAHLIYKCITACTRIQCFRPAIRI